MNINASKYDVLYYVVSEQHLNNAQILFKNTNFKILYIYESDLKILNPKIFKKYKLNYICYNNNEKIKKMLKNFNFNFFFVSTTQLRPLPIILIVEAYLRKIPVYASQEVYQMFLHQSEINNYLIPVDIFFVSSIFEKNEYKKIGYKSERIKVSGWPYQNIIEDKKITKYVLLVITGSNLINPLSKYSLNKIVNIINSILKIKKIKNIDIKFHPNEDKKLLLKILKIFGKRINIIKNIELNKIINEYEYIISDSHSQSLIQAINSKKKLIIFDNNNKNLKEYIDNKIFFKTANELNLILNSDLNYNFIFQKINKYIINITPDDAKKNIINTIKNYKYDFNSFSYEDTLDLYLWYLFLTSEYSFFSKINELNCTFKNFKNKIGDFEYYEDFLNKTKSRVTKNIVIYFRIKYINKHTKSINTKDLNIILNANLHYFRFYIMHEIFFLIFVLVFKSKLKINTKLCNKLLLLYDNINLKFKYRIFKFLIKFILLFKK